jgi:transposase-like protein
MKVLPQTFSQAREYFADLDQCRAYMVKKRWPSGIRCPHCGSSRVYFTAARHGWECKVRHPKRKFSLKTGTVFEDSPLDFDRWLPIVWLIANRHRVSCLDVRRVTGVTHRTAWFMLQRIRCALDDAADGKMAAPKG